MQALTFKRGVHPPDGKELAKDQPIKVIMPKENSELFYPMSQHISCSAIHWLPLAIVRGGTENR